MKIAILIAFKDFRDEELFTPQRVFTSVGAEFKVFSTEVGIAQGADGGTAIVHSYIDNLQVSDFDAIVFIGGPGAIRELDNGRSYKIIHEAVVKEKVLGAICVAPVILAKSKILKGKKATVWTDMGKETREVLEENGAIYENQPVVQDGKIITAVGASAAETFAQKIVQALKE
ncbi:unnamed protein product [marine sediment metagenome]|uniref:DJ-1/PfpI domain-containing protein n=1 Tax=marine sediment metagenome TaxID=412755 RepID=X0WMH9_9ZZZZ